MPSLRENALPAGFLSDLENRFFWWESVTDRPRSADRVIAQAMDRALFEDIRRLETTLALDQLVNVMVQAEPGWFSDRSWEFWRGRLKDAGRAIPETPPRRTF
jgi:hypothetical protein